MLVDGIDVDFSGAQSQMSKFKRYCGSCTLASLLLVACGGSLPPRSAALDPSNANGPESAPLSVSLFATESVASLESDGAHRETSGEAHAGHGHAAAHEHATHGNSPVPQQQAESSEAAAVYTCPMHPEVVSSGPGKCPKCGMKLVPKKDSP
jgi:hypothetical protein